MKKLKPVIGRSGTPDVRSFGTHDYGCEERSDGRSIISNRKSALRLPRPFGLAIVTLEQAKINEMVPVGSPCAPVYRHDMLTAWWLRVLAKQNICFVALLRTSCLAPFIRSSSPTYRSPSPRCSWQTYCHVTTVRGFHSNDSFGIQFPQSKTPVQICVFAATIWVL